MLRSRSATRRGPLRGGLSARTGLVAVVVVAAAVGLATFANWRVALLAELAAAAIALTRMRFSGVVAVILFAVVVVLALAGRTAGSDQRDHDSREPRGAAPQRTDAIVTSAYVPLSRRRAQLVVR
jgi:hypothetical protein